MYASIKIQSWRKICKVPFITYADLEPLLEKMNTCQNNPKVINN